MRESRREQREKFSSEVRLDLLEFDMDESDRSYKALKADIHSMKTMMMGVIISAATASIIGAINLFYQRIGG